MTNDEIRSFIENAIKENRVMLFMKGTRAARVRVRAHLGSAQRSRRPVRGARHPARPAHPRGAVGLSGWPTIPQLFVAGELIGGCDIVMEMFESGELAEVLGVEQPAEAAAPEPGAPVRQARPSGWKTA